jgi:transcriptional antiterminator NusG
MAIFAAQVKAGREDKIIRQQKSLADKGGLRIYCPKRLLKERRRGQITEDIKVIFPGYIFIELAEAEDVSIYRREFLATDGFVRFLPSNIDIRALSGRDLEIITHFIVKPGAVAGISHVKFDENMRIIIKDGPLLGLEGQIVKVDRRKGRAKVKLDLYKNSFALDFAFELLDEA